MRTDLHTGVQFECQTESPASRILAEVMAWEQLRHDLTDALAGLGATALLCRRALEGARWAWSDTARDELDLAFRRAALFSPVQAPSIVDLIRVPVPAADALTLSSGQR